MKIAYIMSRFPKLTETFILYEMVAMEKLGVALEVYPLIRERTTVMHPLAKRFVEKAHFFPFLSMDIIRSNLKFLASHPLRYLGTLLKVLKGTWRSPRFFFGALAIFPKTVHMAQVMKASGITHVHAHFANHPAAAAYIIRHLVGIPYTFTAHGSDIHRDQTMLAEKVMASNFTVTISEFNRRFILDASQGQGDEKLKVIHCGVDTALFQPKAKEDNQCLRLICTGSLHEVKGQRHLIDACQALADRGVRFHCNFVGDGVDRKDLEEAVSSAGMGGNVTFHGSLEHAAIRTLLGQVDVSVAPSVPSSDGRREGIPVVLMEAMACGLPVVSSQLSGIPELVRHGESGFLTEPGDAKAIADHLERLWNDPALRQKMGRAARETVIHDFDLHKNTRRLAQQIEGSAQ